MLKSKERNNFGIFVDGQTKYKRERKKIQQHHMKVPNFNDCFDDGAVFRHANRIAVCSYHSKMDFHQPSILGCRFRRCCC